MSAVNILEWKSLEPKKIGNYLPFAWSHGSSLFRGFVLTTLVLTTNEGGI